MHLVRTRPLLFPALVGLLLIAAFLLGGRTVAFADEGDGGGGFQQTNLASNLPGVAPVTDPSLLNPWGLVSSSTSPWWVSDNNGGVSTLYSDTNGVFAKVALTVTIPAPTGSPAGTMGAPTGVVFNGDSSEFLVPGTTTASRFIFDTENGTVLAWGGGAAATIAVDNSAAGAVYKGLAIASTTSGDQLYATNFGQGRVDVFDSNFAPVTLPAGAFTDPRIPAAYSPFGIATIGGMLFVTYAIPNGSGDEVLGQGLGFIDVYSLDGTLLQRFARHGLLNAPWGMAVAPAGFGQFGGDLLVGNFGDGHVDAYSMSGELLGPLHAADGRRLTIDGLWALAFGNDAAAGPASTLFFTAGPDDQADGLFGTLTPAPMATGGNH